VTPRSNVMLSNKFFRILYQQQSDNNAGGNNTSNDNQTGNQNDQQEQNTQQPSYASFDEFYKSLSAENQRLVAPAKEHFDKVYGTISEVRKERDGFSKQLKDLSKQLEGNKEAQAKVDELSKSLDGANKKADFFAEAIQNECKNPKAAFALALASDLFTRDGAPDWKAIKAEAPELFGQKATKKSSAGSGTRTEQPRTGGINEWIREQAGRNVISET